MTGGSACTLPSPFLNWESEGLNRNQSQQFIFNFFLLSRDWFLSLWSMARRKAPWPEQLFKHLVWSAPHLSNRTLEADYGSNRMKMFEGWAWLPLPSWEECLQAGGCLCSSPGESCRAGRQQNAAITSGQEPVGGSQEGQESTGDSLPLCQSDSLPPFVFSTLFLPPTISSLLYQLLLDFGLQVNHLLQNRKERERENCLAFSLSLL